LRNERTPPDGEVFRHAERLDAEKPTRRSTTCENEAAASDGEAAAKRSKRATSRNNLDTIAVNRNSSAPWTPIDAWREREESTEDAVVSDVRRSR